MLIEPLPWPGDLSRNFDNTNRGQSRVEVVDAKTGDMLYSRDFSTIFGEWRTKRGGAQNQPRLPRIGTFLDINAA